MTIKNRTIFEYINEAKKTLAVDIPKFKPKMKNTDKAKFTYDEAMKYFEEVGDGVEYLLWDGDSWIHPRSGEVLWAKEKTKPAGTKDYSKANMM